MTFSIRAHDPDTGYVGVDRGDDPIVELRSHVEAFGEQLLPQIQTTSTREDHVGQMTREAMVEDSRGNLR